MRDAGYVVLAVLLCVQTPIASAASKPPAGLAPQSPLFTLVLKGFPKGDKGKKREGKQRRAGEGRSGGKGKCGRLADKYGIPKNECRNLSGEKKCKRLAERYGLPRSECR